MTVFGHGAGATSACLQAVIPPPEGKAPTRLAQAAIMESGACYAQPVGACPPMSSHADDRRLSP